MRMDQLTVKVTADTRNIRRLMRLVYILRRLPLPKWAKGVIFDLVAARSPIRVHMDAGKVAKTTATVYISRTGAGVDPAE